MKLDRLVPKIVALFFLIGETVATAKGPHRRAPSALPRRAAPSIESALVRPSLLRRSDAFYVEYFAKQDERIRRDYLDRWEYHDRSRPLFSSNDARMRGLGVSPSTAPNAIEMRRQFAAQVMRLRLETALTQSFQQQPGLRPLGRAHQAIAYQSVPLSSQPGVTRELRFGYDVFADVCRLEYLWGAWETGLYHNLFFTSLSTGNPYAGPFYLQVATRSLKGVAPALRYRLDSRTWETSISKTLAPNLDGALVSSHPPSSAPASYGISLSYRF